MNWGKLNLWVQPNIFENIALPIYQYPLTSIFVFYALNAPPLLSIATPEPSSCSCHDYTIIRCRQLHQLISYAIFLSMWMYSFESNVFKVTNWGKEKLKSSSLASIIKRCCRYDNLEYDSILFEFSLKPCCIWYLTKW